MRLKPQLRRSAMITGWQEALANPLTDGSDNLCGRSASGPELLISETFAIRAIVSNPRVLSPGVNNYLVKLSPACSR